MNKNIAKILQRGGIGILATDTTYGLVGSALNQSTVERVYDVRGRDKDKPCIVLISSITDLAQFAVLPTVSDLKILEKIWPGAVSVVFSCSAKKFSYLHRGTKTVAFRLPRQEALRALLDEVGPLVAPSANPQGLPVAHTINHARKYFADKVDFYQDAGFIESAPSTLIKIEREQVAVLRQGVVDVSSISQF